MRSGCMALLTSALGLAPSMSCFGAINATHPSCPIYLLYVYISDEHHLKMWLWCGCMKAHSYLVYLLIKGTTVTMWADVFKYNDRATWCKDLKSLSWHNYGLVTGLNGPKSMAWGQGIVNSCEGAPNPIKIPACFHIIIIICYDHVFSVQCSSSKMHATPLNISWGSKS